MRQVDYVLLRQRRVRLDPRILLTQVVDGDARTVGHRMKRVALLPHAVDGCFAGIRLYFGGSRRGQHDNSSGARGAGGQVRVRGNKVFAGDAVVGRD